MTKLLDHLTQSHLRYIYTVNVLKFWTLYSILFCFLCSCFLKWWNGKQCTLITAVKRSSLIWDCTVSICHFARHFGVWNCSTLSVTLHPSQHTVYQELSFRNILKYFNIPVLQGLISGNAVSHYRRVIEDNYLGSDRTFQEALHQLSHIY